MNRVDESVDYPRLRAARTCCLCGQQKALKCLVCWGCFRLYNFREGANGFVLSLLAEWERGTP